MKKVLLLIPLLFIGCNQSFIPKTAPQKALQPQNVSSSSTTDAQDATQPQVIEEAAPLPQESPSPAPTAEPVIDESPVQPAPSPSPSLTPEPVVSPSPVPSVTPQQTPSPSVTPAPVAGVLSVTGNYTLYPAVQINKTSRFIVMEPTYNHALQFNSVNGVKMNGISVEFDGQKKHVNDDWTQIVYLPSDKSKYPLTVDITSGNDRIISLSVW